VRAAIEAQLAADKARDDNAVYYAFADMMQRIAALPPGDAWFPMGADIADIARQSSIFGTQADEIYSYIYHSIGPQLAERIARSEVGVRLIGNAVDQTITFRVIDRNSEELASGTMRNYIGAQLDTGYLFQAPRHSQPGEN
jgi:hypothetical protein